MCTNPLSLSRCACVRRAGPTACARVPAAGRGGGEHDGDPPARLERGVARFRTGSGTDYSMTAEAEELGLWRDNAAGELEYPYDIEGMGPSSPRPFPMRRSAITISSMTGRSKAKGITCTSDAVVAFVEVVDGVSGCTYICGQLQPVGDARRWKLPIGGMLGPWGGQLRPGRDGRRWKLCDSMCQRHQWRRADWGARPVDIVVRLGSACD